MGRKKDESDALFHQRCGDRGLTAAGVVREQFSDEAERQRLAAEERRQLILDGDLDPKCIR